ncbi:MAG: hypothetical protein BGP25_00180 [Lysobacterales bacterium 63-13]|nr:MAG: hypothetical protein BGP25_00180 [Xanthomonadales bacterium 63-13]
MQASRSQKIRVQFLQLLSGDLVFRQEAIVDKRHDQLMTTFEQSIAAAARLPGLPAIGSSRGEGLRIAAIREYS